MWERSPRSIEVLTFDGDGVAITIAIRSIAGPLPRAPFPSAVCNALVHGYHRTADRPVTVRVLDRAGREIQSQTLSSQQMGRPLPTIQPWIVAVGNSLGVEATSVTQTDTCLPNFTTTVITSADDMPDQWRGLSACDLLILPSAPATAAPAAPLETSTSTSTSQTAGDGASQTADRSFDHSAVVGD